MMEELVLIWEYSVSIPRVVGQPAESKLLSLKRPTLILLIAMLLFAALFGCLELASTFKVLTAFHALAYHARCRRARRC